MCLEALKLYQTGLSQREAARRAGISQYVLTEWLRKYGKEMRPSSLKQRFQEAKTAKDWLVVLRGTAQTKSTKSGSAARLICEVIYSNAGINKLVAIIGEGLRIDPLNGELFVFCNKEYNIITTITWNGIMFNVSKFPRQHGKYPWPHERFGASITVSAFEFETLMFFQQKRVE
jgi:transcriptional regulator with XRE-family HTH domain